LRNRLHSERRAPYLDRLTLAEYSIDERNKAFAIDDLGSRDSVNVPDGNSVDYEIDDLTSRCDSVGGNALACDAAAKTSGYPRLHR